ncbi:SGNH/GDSL hydrolase family protein [Halobacillus sp. KGW1]|uniref:SGNH/GDSL hydrolase family protein n=1 Tax=Halobacillus sp. KGW1 TaxID=1793726 RepID=UPI000783B1BE|nr:SGNH/GDSL hydrolase family protein [Halobacillus sp. KGW1]
MKKWRWIASISLSLFLAFFITAAFIYTPEEHSTDSDHSTVKKERSESKPASSEPKEQEFSPDEEDSDRAISEGLKDVFTGVIDSAKGLFVKDDMEIVALGDSLTQGVGDDTDNGGYVGILEDTFNSNKERDLIHIDNFGKRGNRTDQLIRRLEEQEEISTALEEADLILITIGANDVMKVVKDNFTNLNYQDFVDAQDSYQAQLETIFSMIREENPDAPIYLIGLYNPFNLYFDNIPELGKIMEDWNEISKEVVAEEENVTFIPVRDLFEGSEDELLWEEDNFHPNERGYKQMAKRVLEYIKDDVEQ